MENSWIFIIRSDQVWSFLNSNDRRKIQGRVFVEVLEHDENCVSLYGVCFFEVKTGIFKKQNRFFAEPLPVI